MEKHRAERWRDFFFHRFLPQCWGDIKASVAEQVVGATLALLILIAQIQLGIVSKDAIRVNLLAIMWPYVALIGIFILYHLVRAPWLVSNAHLEKYVDLAARAEETQKELEDAQSRIYDGRPLLVLDTLGTPRWDDEASGEYTFCISNKGRRSARWVQPESITSKGGRYRLHFESTAGIGQNERPCIGHWVEDIRAPELIATTLDKHMLREFIYDGYDPNADIFEKLALVRWEVVIKFRDTDESVKSDITHLCYDYQSACLYTTDAPYTERGFKPPSKP